jgi:DNA-binding NarL/FixJ family response regulator
VATVLIADNDSAVSSLLMDVLSRRGLVIQQAFDGEVARERARQPGIAVVVCDLDMPRASGIEVLESLVDLPVPPAVVVMSGYLDQAIVSRLERLPFVREVLRKPFDLMRFAERVCELAATPSPGPER